ncbi:MAG: HD domain-containing protein [bacterium]|nr:HD domain-containing protein [bacterium]
MAFKKIVRSPTFGLMTFEGAVGELIETPEFQRLTTIRQLGPMYLVYPGTHHSRSLHAMEVSHIATNMGMKLGLSKQDILILGCAGLLHDIGHGPYSHATEILYHDLYHKDHMDYTCRLITGKAKLELPEKEAELLNLGKIPVILKKYKINPADIADLIRKKYTKKPYLQELIFGSIDVDQLAFLLTDSRFSGVTYGDVSLDTLSEFFSVQNIPGKGKHLVASEKAIPAIKDMIMARLSMYNFYLTDTGLIVGNMIQTGIKRAIKTGEIKHFHIYTDDEIRTILINSKDPIARKMGVGIKYRRVFKIAFKIPPIFNSKQKDFIQYLKKNGYNQMHSDIYKKQETVLRKLSRIGAEKLKQLIYNRIKDKNLDIDEIFINMKSLKYLDLTEPRLKNARDILIKTINNQILPLIAFEPFFIFYVENANCIPASFYLAVPSKYRDKAKEAILQIIKS